MRVGIVGARRVRSGIGPFVARFFHEAGADVSAVCGSTPESARLAAKHLSSQYAIEAKSYGNLNELLSSENLDILAICSPTPAHQEHLERALGAGVHVLCDKPLVWPLSEGVEAERLIDGFNAQGKLLALNTQWPETLSGFRELFPKSDLSNVSAFEMELAPSSLGAQMAIDSLSHPISMLQALSGPGEIEDIEITWADSLGDSNDLDDLTLHFRYIPVTTPISVRIRLHRCIDPPRPALYGIGSYVARREIDLASYTFSLCHEDRTIPLADPLRLRIERFLSDVESGAKMDDISLKQSMTHLVTLVRAVEVAERELQ